MVLKKLKDIGFKPKGNGRYEFINTIKTPTGKIDYLITTTVTNIVGDKVKVIRKGNGDTETGMVNVENLETYPNKNLFEKIITEFSDYKI